MVDTPVFISGSYDASGRVLAAWQYSGAVNFILAVFQGEPAGTSWIASTPVTGYIGSLTIKPASLDPSFAYTVAVAVDQGNGVPGPWSVPLSLVFQRVTGIFTTYTGNALTVGWTIPYPSSIAKVAVALTNTTTGITISKTSSGIYNDNEVTFALKTPLAIGDAYTLALTGVSGTFSGPPAGGPAPIVAAPKLSSLTYTVAKVGTAKIAAIADVVFPAPAPQVVMQLYEDGVSILQQRGQGFVAQLDLAAPLSLWSTYTVGLFYQDGSNIGPVGNHGNVLQTAPTIVSTAFDGTNVTVTWTILPGDPAPTGAQATLYDVANKNNVVGAGFANGLSTTFAPDETLGVTGNYALALCPLQGQSQGAEGPATPVIAATRAITSLGYDGARILVAYADALGTNVTGYVLHLMSGTQSVRQIRSGLTGGLIDIALDQTTPYQVAVQAVGGVATGPIGPAITVITQVPALGNIALSAPNNAPQVAAQITPPGVMPNGASYLAYLYEGDRQVAGPITASGSPLIAVFSIDAFGKSGFTVRAAATATINSATVTGPLSPAAPVLGAAPRITSVMVEPDAADATRWRFTIEWVLPDVAPGALATSAVTVMQGASAVATSPDATGTGVQFSVAMASIDATKPGSITVASKGPFGVSPCSVAVSVAFAAPALRSVVCGNREIAADWTWSQADSAVAAIASSYRILLYDLSVSPPALIHVSASTQSLSSGLSMTEAPLGHLTNVGIGIEVDAGLSQCRSAGSPTALVLDPPAITSSAVSGTTLTLAWASPAIPAGVTISGYLARFRVGGGAAMTATISGTAATATIDLGTISGLTDDPIQPAQVTLAVQALTVTGPESDGVPVLRHAATATPNAIATATTIVAQWEPAPGPVETYKVVIAKDGTAVMTAYSPVAVITVPNASQVKDSTYMLAVTPMIGAAAGPASPSLGLALIAPALSDAVFDGKIVTATVTPPGIGTTLVTGYRMMLSVNGRTTQSYDAPFGGTIAMPVDRPIDASAAYAVSASALAGNAVGPLANPAVMISSAPAITAVTCTGTSLVVTLDPSSVAVGGTTLQGWLYTDGIVGDAVVANDNKVTFTVAAGHGYQVASQAIKGGSKGPLSSPIAALTVSPALASAIYRDGQLAIAWSGTDGNGCYLVTVATTAAPVIQSRVSGLGTILAFNADPTISYTLAVQQIDGIVTGPAMAGTAIATSGCAVSSVVFTDTATATITWSAPTSQAASVTQYQVVAVTTDAGAEQILKIVSAPTMTASVSTAGLSPGLSYVVAVRPVITNATGPIGPPIPLVACLPSGLEAYYDGHAIVAQWTAAADPRITGYHAIISIAGQNDIPVDTASTSFRYVYDISGVASTAPIAVKVAAWVGSGSIGPNTAAVDVRTGNPAFYVGDLPSGVVPAVYACPTVPPGATDLVFYLPELFATHQTTAITQGPFTLTPMTPVVAPYAYTVSIATSSDLWSFASVSARQTIASQFASFLATIAGTTGAFVETPRILQQTLAAGLPLSFTESLFYRYSFDPLMRYVDLQAGMRLEIRFESYQYVTGNSDGIDGFVTGTSVVYDIAALPEGSGLGFIALDPFLGSLQAISFGAPQQGGAGGIIDLQTAAYRRPFIRLFYPASFPSGQSTGSPDANHAVAVVAATTWSALDGVTQSFIQFGTLPAASATVSITYFRGRAVLTPLIAVSINGASSFVPLGTTLGSTFAAHGLMPALTGVAASGLSLRRAVTPNLSPTEIASGIKLANKRPVMALYQKLAALSDGTTVFDLPLVQGDEILTGRHADALAR